MRRSLALSCLALLVGCAGSAGERSRASEVTPCRELVPWCTADRLPDVTLTGGRRLGAFGSIDGFDLTGVLSFDEALERAGTYDRLPEATTVQVVLGSADADALSWGRGANLYYAIDWGGLCSELGPTGPPGPPTCAPSS